MDKRKIFYIGLILLIIGIIYLPFKLYTSALMFLCSLFCFGYSKNEFKRFFIVPDMKQFIELKRRKKRLNSEIKILKKEKNVLENYKNNRKNLAVEYNKYVTISNAEKETKNKNNILKEQKEELEKNINNLEKDILNLDNILAEKKTQVSNFEKKLNFLEKEKQSKTLKLDNILNDKKRQISNVEERLNQLKEVNQEYEQKQKFKEYTTIDLINNLDGLEFEEFITRLLIFSGFSATLTPSSNDYGVDVVAEKNKIKYAIQCKHYSNSVGNKAIQEVYSGKDFYHCQVGIVATNSDFTQQAIEQAKGCNVILWNKKDILNMIEEL